MGILGRRRQAKQLAMDEFVNSWSLAIASLGALEESYEQAPNIELKTDLLNEYARYGTQCLLAMINGTTIGAPTLEENPQGQAYFPEDLNVGRLIMWADSKRIRPKIAYAAIGHAALKRAVLKFREGGSTEDYLDALRGYAVSVHLSLRAVFDPT